MSEDIQDKPQNYHRSGEGTSKSSFAKVNRNEYSNYSGMEGYDYSFVNVEVTRSGKTKTIRMFSKSIDQRHINEKDGRVSPEEVMKRHSELKKLGLPVPNTLRISEDRRHILMTDMTQDGKFEIIDRHNTYSGTEIKNKKEMKDKVKEYAALAEANGLVFSPDAFAILVDKMTGYGQVAILDIGSGVYSQEKLNEMGKEKTDISKEAAEDFNLMLDLRES